MIDPLLARAQLAIEEGQRLQHQSRTLQLQHARNRELLRMAVFESAMTRSESKALRDRRQNKEK
jgi:hypothetical protein